MRRRFELDMHHRVPAPLSLVAVLVGLSAPVGAQSVLEFEGTHVSTPWPTDLGGAGSFGRSAAGRLTPNDSPEWLVLDGTAPVIFQDADPRIAPLELTLAAVDVATLGGIGPDGSDAFALLEPGGPSVVTFDPVAWDFVSAPIQPTSGWVDSTLLRSADVNADGLDDLIGVGANGTTVELLLATGSGDAFVDGGSFESPWTVRDVVPLQWDADAALELGTLSDWGVEVLDVDGFLLDSWPAVLPGGTLARLSQVGPVTDRLAWITAYAPPAEQFLMTLSPGGGVDDLINLGALDAFATVGGDYDLDGDDDLLVTHRFSNELIWIENQRSPSDPDGDSFAALNQDVILFRVGPPGTGATLNDAWPVMTDLDGDGDLDILYAAETSMTLDLMRGDAVAEEDQKPTIGSTASWTLPDTPGNGTFQIEVHAPASLAPNATHLELDIWRRDSLAADFDAAGTHHQVIPLPGTWPLVIDLELPETEIDFSAIYAVEARLVELDGGGATLDQLPSTAGFFTMDPATVAALLAEPESEGEVTVVGVQPGSGPTNLGSYIKRPQVGLFNTGSKPKPGV